MQEFLNQFCFPEKTRNLFAFDYKTKFNNFLGFNIFDFEREFQRLFGKRQMIEEGWRVCSINNDFSVCPSYPAKWIVPSGITDEELRKITEFRSKARIPILSWYHPKLRSSLTRCSQPKVGPLKKRCEEDEKMLGLIIKSNPRTFLYVMDARPLTNAVANQAKKGGSENIDNYQNGVLEYLGIENIHVMRDSLKKLKGICWNFENDPHFYANLESTGWLNHISLLIGSSKRIAQLIDTGSSVLVHCSDGWDRTSQLVSIAQLLIDPYYRTMAGFAVLIEKDWIQCGHKFEQVSIQKKDHLEYYIFFLNVLAAISFTLENWSRTTQA